jgi:hypothetical protein
VIVNKLAATTQDCRRKNSVGACIICNQIVRLIN